MIDGRKGHGHQIDLTEGLEIPKSFYRHKNGMLAYFPYNAKIKAGL
jgi:hypothetical protein